jgi:hypothetical protein
MAGQRLARRYRASVTYLAVPGKPDVSGGWLRPPNKTHRVSKGVDMNRIHHIRRLVSVLAGLAAALAASVMGGTAAFAATQVFPPPEPAATPVSPLPTPPAGPLSRFEPVSHTYHGLAGGVPGWQIALIAVGAAIVGAAVGAVVAVLADRSRAARRHLPAAAA